MAGHNKWSKVKRLKAVIDAKKGKVFSRFAKEIAVAVRLGGADPAMNPRLRAAIQSARSENMPNDNIERATRKGSGAGTGGALEECVYEGYGPCGAALLVEAATDNKNRTAPDLRRVFGDHGGNLASSGSTAYLFQRIGELEIDAPAAEEDRLLTVLLETGAGDFFHDGSSFHVTTPPERLASVLEALRSAGFAVRGGRLSYEPRSFAAVDEDGARRVEELCGALEELDDVVAVHSNHAV